jgi:AAA+ ATPase superfamily predicted ATPase
MVFAPPAEVFDREMEWAALERFVEDRAGRLGVVWGARRVGKSFLLWALCEAVGGLYVQAVRQDAALSLADLGRLAGARAGAPAPFRFDGWAAAVDALLDLPGCPLVVLDEFPYLVEASPELPTVVQAAVDARGRRPGKLILCGSAVSQMTRLLGADGPLYRRAALSLRLGPFDLRTAARFWRLASRPDAALAVHAVVGGVPGYRQILGPPGDDIDDWIVERVLDPTRALFHEDDLVFATDPSLPDANVYRSILAAVVAGQRTPTGVARATGRKATSLVRPLDRLEDAGLLVRTSDPLRERRSLLDVADPFLRFHYAVIRPQRARISRGQAAQVWASARTTYRSQVLGPHFELVCRQMVADHGPDLGLPAVVEVGATLVADPAARTSHEVDIAGVDATGRVLLIGEAKAGVAPSGGLTRLERIRSLLPPGRAAPEVHLAVFTASPAAPALSRAARARADATVIDLPALYGRRR